MKGVTPIIAVILVLLITISLTGMAFLFISTASESAKTLVAQQQAQESGGSPRIDHVTNYTVYVFSAGRTELKNPVFYVNGQRIDSTGPAVLTPGLIGTYELNQQQLQGFPDVSEVKVTAGNSIDILVAKIREVFPSIITMGTNLAMGSVVTAQANAIIFQSNAGKTLVTITDGGNVGIGTTTPVERLDVAGRTKTQELCIGADCRSAWPAGGSTSYTVVTEDCSDIFCVATCPKGQQAIGGGCTSAGYQTAFGANTLGCTKGDLGGECTASWLCSTLNNEQASIRTTVICAPSSVVV